MDAGSEAVTGGWAALLLLSFLVAVAAVVVLLCEVGDEDEASLTSSLSAKRASETSLLRDSDLRGGMMNVCVQDRMPFFGLCQIRESCDSDEMKMIKFQWFV